MDKNISMPLKIMIPAMINKMVNRLSPAKVGIQVTNDCNLDCSYCYSGSRKFDRNDGFSADVLSFDEICCVIDDLSKMNIIHTGSDRW
jgi:MoaA/NifB/PqqE/SkfB family radical SAM enzyme